MSRLSVSLSVGNKRGRSPRECLYDQAMYTTHLLYLHGFRSSPHSAKAQKMAAIVQRYHPGVTWWCPQLPPSPELAMAQVIAQISAWPDTANFQGMAVVGSSLGGFYATCIAEQMACKAVLLNPAIYPARDLLAYVGEQTAWHAPEDTFFFKPEFIGELQAMEAGPLADLKRYLAVIAKGDQVLDWHEMTARYSGAQIRLLEGGDHALSDFDDHLPEILGFLQLAG
jgi:predicted esterase YcpF (UPF0227 family)